VKLELTAGDTEKERREILEWISREEGGWWQLDSSASGQKPMADFVNTVINIRLPQK
jgi:hypothetical protein